jgi:hypothetical protein
MTHEDVGHFAAKHPQGTKIDPAVEEKIRQHLVGDQLTCAAAHKIAKAFSIPPSQVGTAMDLMEVRIGKCQMGLFGYHPVKRIVKPAKSVSPQLEESIRNILTDQRISCRQCWDLAKAHNLTKFEVASACETLNIRINQCQLGAF